MKPSAPQQRAASHRSGGRPWALRTACCQLPIQGACKRTGAARVSGRHGVVPSVLAENSPRVFEGAAGKLAMPVRVPTGARALREPRDAPYKQPSRTTLHKILRVFEVSRVGDQRRLQKGCCACLQPASMLLCDHGAAGCPDPSACVYLRKCTMVCGANAAVFVLCGSLVESLCRLSRPNTRCLSKPGIHSMDAVRLLRKVAAKRLLP